jgi:hypothetical protein
MLDRLIQHLSFLENGFDGFMEDDFCFVNFLLDSHDHICLTWILESSQILKQWNRISGSQGCEAGSLRFGVQESRDRCLRIESVIASTFVGIHRESWRGERRKCEWGNPYRIL